MLDSLLPPKKKRCDVGDNAKYIPWNNTVKDFIIFHCFGSSKVDEKSLFGLHMKTVAAVVRHMATEEYKYKDRKRRFGDRTRKSNDVSDTHI